MQISRDEGGRALIGGWLYLPAIYTVLNPLWLGFGFYQLWRGYDPLFSSHESIVFFCVLIGTCLMFVLSIANAWWLNIRSPNYPKGIIGFYLFDAISLAVLVYSFSKLREAGADKDLFRAIMSAAIFVPYMLLSKRVRETFGWPRD